MQGGKGLWEAFIVSGETAEPCRPCKGAFYYPTCGRRTKPHLASGSLTTFQVNLILRGGFRDFAAHPPLYGGKAEYGGVKDDTVKRLKDIEKRTPGSSGW